MLFVPLDVDRPSVTVKVGSRTFTQPIKGPAPTTTTQGARRASYTCTSGGTVMRDPHFDQNEFTSDPQAIDPILMATAAFDQFVRDIGDMGVPESFATVTGVLTGEVDANGIPVVRTDWSVLANISGLTAWLDRLPADSIALLMQDLSLILFWGYMAGCV